MTSHVFNGSAIKTNMAVTCNRQNLSRSGGPGRSSKTKKKECVWIISCHVSMLMLMKHVRIPKFTEILSVLEPFQSFKIFVNFPKTLFFTIYFINTVVGGENGPKILMPNFILLLLMRIDRYQKSNNVEMI